MAINIYNTMSRTKEELVPRDEGKISMYVCGPTVYNYIHIGNARTFLNFDMVRRYLEFSGFEVTFVQNITDVDDKIINRANEEGTTADAVATRYREAFERDMAALGVKPPDIAPRATDNIPDMIEVIEALLEKGYAYVSYGDVYFDVSSFEGYAKLSGRELDEQQVTVQSSAEIERKDDPWDFALWKEAKPGEPSWKSPWGQGRPGWHIECSTMSTKYLGTGFDVHGGGLDLVFPHHDNEIAQSESYVDGSCFVRYWMHSGMLNSDQEKMSKSLGNIKTLREVLDEHDADTVRMLMLGTHYRSPLSFSDMSLSEARASLERIKNCLFNLDDLMARVCGGEAEATQGKREYALEQFLKEAGREFREHMDDDFNSAAALGVVFGAVREVNTYVDKASAAEVPAAAAGSVLEGARSFFESYCGALGLFQDGATAQAEAAVEGPDAAKLVELLHAAGAEEAGLADVTAGQLVELLLEKRQSARAGKDFALADRIRDELAGLGVRVEDVRDGHRWRFEE